MTRIVVGVDDSPGGRAALAWALEEARLRDAELEVTHVFSLPWTEGLDADWPTVEASYADQAKQMLERLIADASTTATAVKPVSVVLRSEGPAFGLLERSKGADLLVVGTRGRGGFAGVLLGSVSTQCVQHANCPTVVVPLRDHR